MRPLDSLIRLAAEAIELQFDAYRAAFKEITHRARKRFEERDWAGGQRDAAERLDLYRAHIDAIEQQLGEILASSVDDPAVWSKIKHVHSELAAERADEELDETFFNSITRRIFDTVGVDSKVEYVDLDIRRTRYGPAAPMYRAYPVRSSLDDVVRSLLQEYAYAIPFRDLERDVSMAAEAIRAKAAADRAGSGVHSIQMIEPVFYRGSAAYLVGRVRTARAKTPLVLVLVNSSKGIEVDAVLMSETEVSILFSFTRSHFHVDVTRPSEAVRLLSSIMPRKPVAELYISLGHSKHGKTELYRDLIGHLGRSMGRFEHAQGDTGMVMIVFTLRSFDYVFKVIRDQFAYPKTNTREEVMQRYQLVFRHDRAGRLIEAQEFEHLSIDRRRFAPELLDELQSAAANNVTVEGHEVTIHHLYVERRVRPLNLFLREKDEAAAAEALLDYGQCIRDLAQTNIFPGDLLLKNFGVTRHGRVTFYDYDELRLVTECEFRDLPSARDSNEEMSAEPWFYVGENDVFPEEFIRFLGLNDNQRRVFLDAHAAVLTAEFWRDLQRKHRSGEVLDVFPYPKSKRLRATASERGA